MELGKNYLVEPGVVACLRGFVKSTGFSGKKMIHLTIVEGTNHPFTGINDMSPVSDFPVDVRGRFFLDFANFVTVNIVKPSYFKSFPTESLR